MSSNTHQCHRFSFGSSLPFILLSSFSIFLSFSASLSSSSILIHYIMHISPLFLYPSLTSLSTHNKTNKRNNCRSSVNYLDKSVILLITILCNPVHQGIEIGERQFFLWSPTIEGSCFITQAKHGSQLDPHNYNLKTKNQLTYFE